MPQLNTTISETTSRMLGELTERGYTKRVATEIAIQRLYKEELGESDEDRIKDGCQVKCANCGDVVFPDDAHEFTTNGGVLCWSCSTPEEEKRAKGIIP